jgi:diguanylate cyclase (GGDEF)-like protein
MALSIDPAQRTTSAILELAGTRREPTFQQRLAWLGHELYKRSWELTFLPVVALPLLTIGVLLYARYGELVHPRQYLTAQPQLFYSLLVANALLGLGLAVWSYFLFSERQELVARFEAVQRDKKERGEELLRLEKEMELLTAMRNLSTIINDDVQFEAVWTRVLEVLMSIVQCRRITIFTVDPDRRPRARILHHRGRTVFGDAIVIAELDMTNVAETLEYRTMLRAAEGSQCFWTYPLMADGEVMGVLQIVAGLTGDADEKVLRIERHEETIRHLLKHISLALKTPTLYDRATLDGLTGLFNKQHFISELHQAFRVARRNRTPFTLVLSDIDFFKSVNDTHGHLIGDRCLQVVGQVLKEQVRASDLVFRYGGEEMVLLLPGTEQDDGIALAERVHAAIAAAEIPLPDGERLHVTASMGVCQYHPSVEQPEELVARADQALYVAKRRGRNQVFFWNWEGPSEAVDTEAESEGENDATPIERTPNSPRKRLKKPRNAR